MGGVVELPVRADVVIRAQRCVYVSCVDGSEAGVVRYVDAAAGRRADAAGVAVGGAGHVGAECRGWENGLRDVEVDCCGYGRVLGVEVCLRVISFEVDVGRLCTLGFGLGEDTIPPCVPWGGCEAGYGGEIAIVEGLVGG